MAYGYPYGNGQQLNLDWFLEEWKNLLAAWEAEKSGITGALDAEIAKAEAALADVFAARDAAAQSASDANASKTAAAQSATDAVAAKDAAAQSASDANASKSAAAQSASDADASKSAAAQSASDADTSKRAAAQSASDADASKSAAAQSASDADASKSAAAQSASDADTSKRAAAQSAEDAENAAELINLDATENDIGKALIVKTVSDGKVSGYEFGEASGGTVEIVNTIENVQIATFDDAVENSEVKKLVVSIEPVQSGTGNPSPENIRPIGGWENCNIYHSGEDTENPNVIQITFPSSAGTVYGGTLTINEDGSGTVTVDRFKGNIINVVNKVENENGYYWYSTLGSNNFPNIYGLNAKLISNRLITEANLTEGSVNGHMTIYANSIIRWKEQGDLNLQDYRTYIINNPLEVCYQIAEPISYNLATQQVIDLLSGQNNIWTNTGNIIKLQYYADNKKYIDEQNNIVKALIAPVLEDMIADTALVANDFRIVNNTLYRITSPVASGGTLTPNTNCTATTITAILKTLLS